MCYFYDQELGHVTYYSIMCLNRKVQVPERKWSPLFWQRFPGGDGVTTRQTEEEEEKHTE